jgi:hypothetical protein
LRCFGCGVLERAPVDLGAERRELQISLTHSLAGAAQRGEVPVKMWPSARRGARGGFRATVDTARSRAPPRGQRLRRKDGPSAVGTVPRDSWRCRPCRRAARCSASCEEGGSRKAARRARGRRRVEGPRGGRAGRGLRRCIRRSAPSPAPVPCN